MSLPSSSSYLPLSGGNMSGYLTTTGSIGIGITNPFAPSCIGSPATNGSDGYLVSQKKIQQELDGVILEWKLMTILIYYW